MNDTWRPWPFAIKSFLLLMAGWGLITLAGLQSRVVSIESWIEIHDSMGAQVLIKEK
jgi:hypothetical protein